MVAKRWVRVTAGALVAFAAVLCVALGYYYVTFSRLIDERLHGERDACCRASSRGRSNSAAGSR